MSKLTNFIWTPFSGEITQMGYCRVVMRVVQISLYSQKQHHTKFDLLKISIGFLGTLMTGEVLRHS
ncbi:MAG: hypothetical protein CMN54_12820 [SAR324 cluster bacterium]|uniref:Uncharacterized protein n=1 Tax=SAR324 cluster bacterium TaxID=2024889 RepID=A0A2D6YMB0_9DELT|nr:hypothetical protein [SAR324 cluster bacterium]